MTGGIVEDYIRADQFKRIDIIRRETDKVINQLDQSEPLFAKLLGLFEGGRLEDILERWPKVRDVGDALCHESSVLQNEIVTIKLYEFQVQFDCISRNNKLADTDVTVSVRKL